MLIDPPSPTAAIQSICADRTQYTCTYYDAPKAPSINSDILAVLAEKDVGGYRERVSMNSVDKPDKRTTIQ